MIKKIYTEVIKSDITLLGSDDNITLDLKKSSDRIHDGG